jgi:hypothetical protein
MNGIAVEAGITNKASQSVKVMRMCGNAGKMLFVVPAQYRLIGLKQLIGVIDVLIVIV